MDLNKGLFKNIELQLANQVHENFAEVLKGQMSPAEQASRSALSVNELTPEMEQHESKNQQHAEGQSDEATTTLQAARDHVTFERNHKRSYEKLLNEGDNTKQSHDVDQELESILEEVDQSSSGEAIKYLVTERPVMVQTTQRSDEDYLRELEEALEDDDQDSSQEFDEDDDDDSDEEETFSLKEIKRQISVKVS